MTKSDTFGIKYETQASSFRVDVPGSVEMKKIKLSNGGYALVDDDMFDLISLRKWFAMKHHSGRLYAACSSKINGKYKIEKMHHYIVGKPLMGLVTDHLNGQGLDNRRNNLRLVTNRENCANRHFHRNGKLIGASIQRNKWRSQIEINGKKVNLGFYDTEKEAHEKYLAKLMEIGDKAFNIEVKEVK